MYVPAVTSVTVIGLDAPVLERPEDDVAVNVLTALFPLLFAVNGTDTTPDVPPVAVPIVGACGLDVGITVPVADDAADVPMAFVAVTVNVKAVEGVVGKPVTTIGEEDPLAVYPPVFDVTV